MDGGVEIDYADYSCVLDPPTLDNANFQDLKRYWDAKRGSRAMPGRSDIDPVELRRHLGSLILLDVLHGCDDYRYRLIGSKVVQAYGRDSTGKTVRTLLANTEEQYVEVTLDAYRSVARRRTTALTSGSLKVVKRDFVRFECLMLPLGSHDDRVDIILVEQLFFRQA